jgi:hypothetical protein
MRDGEGTKERDALTLREDTKTPPGMLRIVWLDSQDPIPDTADTGRHLMRWEGGSESEEQQDEDGEVLLVH